MCFCFFLIREHILWEKQYKTHFIVLVDLKCHAVEWTALYLWKCSSHSEYCLLTSTQHDILLTWCSSISLRQKWKPINISEQSVCQFFSFSPLWICSQLYCKIMGSVTENFFNSFLNNNSKSFTDLYQNFQFVVLLHIWCPQELIYVLWFCCSKYILNISAYAELHFGHKVCIWSYGCLWKIHWTLRGVLNKETTFLCVCVFNRQITYVGLYF